MSHLESNQAPSGKTTESAPAGSFPSTRWTLVMRVQQGGESRKVALEELCSLYWYPIYVFLRRRGYPRHDAEDLTQGCFIKLLNDQTFLAANVNKGRLRTLLLHTLTCHLADQHRHQAAKKRGGGKQIIAFEAMKAEERYAHEPLDHNDPEWLFTRTWAQLLIEGVREKLRETFEEAGRGEVFSVLLPFLLMEDTPPSYREIAAKLDASETAVRLLVFRMRKSFRELLREEVALTVAGPEEVSGELTWLRSVLTGS